MKEFLKKWLLNIALVSAAIFIIMSVAWIISIGVNSFVIKALLIILIICLVATIITIEG